MANLESICVGDITIDANKNTMIAGPCAVESEEQIQIIGQAVIDMGADALRGGVFKPRTDHRSFQGLGENGMRYLVETGRDLNVPIVVEVMDLSQIAMMLKVAGNHPIIWQVGSRNAQNYNLLKGLGETGIPVLLKRGKGSTVQEMLGAAQYVTMGGSPVLMCERGIVSFSSGDPKIAAGRFTPDHIAVLKFQEAGYLTIFDPSHAAGRADHVVPLSLSGVAIGANGLIVEVHHDACNALCDGKQAINFDQFGILIKKAREIEQIIRGPSL